jgi:hypothetical protein
MPFPKRHAVTDAGAKLQAVPSDGTDCKPITRRLRQRGSGIGDQGSGIRDQGSGIRDQGSEIRDQRLEARSGELR